MKQLNTITAALLLTPATYLGIQYLCARPSLPQHLDVRAAQQQTEPPVEQHTQPGGSSLEPSPVDPAPQPEPIEPAQPVPNKSLLHPNSRPPAWTRDHASAQAESIANQQWVLVLFGADDCPPCMQLLQWIERDDVREVLDGWAVGLKVHAPTMVELTESLGIKQFPSMALFKPGAEASSLRISAPVTTPEAFVEQLKRLKAAYPKP